MILYNLKFYDGYADAKAIIDFVDSREMEDSIGMFAIREDNIVTKYGNCYEVDLYEITTVEGMDE